MEKRTLAVLAVIVTLLGTVAAMYFTGIIGSKHNALLDLAPAKDLADPKKVAELFYSSLSQKKYDIVYEMLHPQVQDEISRSEFTNQLKKTLDNKAVQFSKYQLGSEKTYETWRSPFDTKKRTYKNVTEVEVLLTIMENNKPVTITGVLILAPLEDGTYRVLRL